MRYCTNCGAPIGNNRFCSGCGTDNGAIPADNGINRETSKEAYSRKISVPLLLHMVSALMLAVASVILFSACCSEARDMVVDAALFSGSTLFSLVYFVLGMWSCIPALLLLLNIRKENNSSVFVVSIIMAVMMVVLCILSLFFKNDDGNLRFFAEMFETYKDAAAPVIVFSVLSAAFAVWARMRKGA